MYTKILQITAAYKPAYIYGGPTMSVAKLCEALTEAKVDVEVFTTTANGQKELNVTPNKSIVVDGVNVVYFKRLTKDHTHFSPDLLLGLRRKIKDLNAQPLTPNPQLIIHIHAWWNLVSICSCAIAKWYHIPVILSPRGMLTAYTTTNRNSLAKKIIHTFFGRRLLKYCHIHATSDKEKQDILAIVQPKSITVIHNLVNLPSNLPTFQPSNLPTFKLIFLSRIEEKKGLELLFEALSSLSFAWNLTIAGSGEENYVKSLKQKVESLNLEQRISWVGQVEKNNKFELLANHDLMVLTSYNENFANVVIESLSVGTAVLISDQVGLSDYVKEKKIGWITDLTPENITEQLIKAFESGNSRTIIRETGPQIIIKDFDSKNLIKKYIDLYNSLKSNE